MYHSEPPALAIRPRLEYPEGIEKLVNVGVADTGKDNITDADVDMPKTAAEITYKTL